MLQPNERKNNYNKFYGGGFLIGGKLLTNDIRSVYVVASRALKW
jgi:hypothetical protein